MKLIPVIDLKNGQVVAARQGRRDTYEPLVSPLCPSSQLDEVATAILRRYPVESLYIADLNAIAGDGDHVDQIEQLHRRHPTPRLWVDSGLTALDRLAALVRPVLGSESLESLDQLAELRARYPDAVLSLDYRGEQPLGPAGLAANPALWPDDVILMTLARVGSAQGPDLDRLAALRRLAPSHRIHAAGGVRSPADLERLDALGIAGALVATALHQGHIPAARITQ
ncbi:histidine biosynthesis protein [Thiorhodococcus drewsii AZ1]|uniref:Histidine biosynthesis protein n=1 Tax=Thiorhodococcus drewsii AZ1 TaxID=765913 RepID=G2DX09_9GAMM|nr:HisA/HisF-related TIM barrel protein [Thiorhodococcus drewsii]EGV33363.1 histidine biosynthesis protein [Thiorhodococcus drewsii AZ1]